MTPAEKNQLAALWAAYAGYYRMRLDDVVLRMYADDLSDLDFAQVRDAMEKYRRNPKNRTMPLPAQIREIVQPQVDPESAAREIAARITAAVPKFGWANPQEARAYIGEVGWRVVQKQGGWSYICEHLGLSIDPTVFQAQVRELAKTQLTHSDEAIADAIGLPSATPKAQGELASAKEVLSSFLRLPGSCDVNSLSSEHI